MSRGKETETGTFGGRLKKAREDAGLSKAELARQVGSDDGYLTHLEKDRRTASARMVAALATTLGKNPAWLQMGQGAEAAEPVVHRARRRTAASHLTAREVDAVRAGHDVINAIVEKQPTDELAKLVKAFGAELDQIVADRRPKLP